jgi:polysaccharide deacetylase family protein (PEP-CTERM system associated)
MQPTTTLPTTTPLGGPSTGGAAWRAARAATHIFTVDVEEYFQVTAFERVVARDEWQALPSRVAAQVTTLLTLLARHEVSATFFVLAWVAERHPHVVRDIAAAGHEIASHGRWHRRVTALTPAEFRADVRDAKACLEDVSGCEVSGYRAPSFSVTPGLEWAFDVLLEEGYRYDSSVFPIRRPGYGYPGARDDPHWIARPAGALLELPLATATVLRARLPAAGGAYLRHLPYALIRRAFAQHEARGVPGVFYVHPWELDPEQPRLRVPPLTRLRHYAGLRRTESRVGRLLREFRFTSVRRWLAPDPQGPEHA